MQWDINPGKSSKRPGPQRGFGLTGGKKIIIIFWQLTTAAQDAFKGLGFGNMGLPSVLICSLSFWGLPQRNIHRGELVNAVHGRVAVHHS